MNCCAKFYNIQENYNIEHNIKWYCPVSLSIFLCLQGEVGGKTGTIMGPSTFKVNVVTVLVISNSTLLKFYSECFIKVAGFNLVYILNILLNAH